MAQVGIVPRPHLVAKFAAAIALAFVVVVVSVTWEMVQTARHRAEQQAEDHATFVVASVLGPALDETGRLTEPLRRSDLAAVDAIVRDRVLSDGRTVRVKVWLEDGTLIYSDDTSLVGRRFPDEAAELEEIIETGAIENGVSTLDAQENIHERTVADKLFQTYIPWTSSSGDVRVVEVYQRYAPIQERIDDMVRTLAWIFFAGMLLLFGTVLPIAIRASRELRRTNQDLHAQAETLSDLLANEQQTVEELTKLNQMQTDFVSAASHELRTPLTSIIGYLQALSHPEIAADPDTAHEFLLSAERQTTRLSLLVTKLLSTAGIANGSPPLEVSSMELSVVCDRVLEALAVGRARIDVLAQPSIVVTDIDRLHEIMLNLVENALKFSAMEARVELRAGTEGEGGPIVISVRDHGIGVDPAEHGAIFERFHQVDQSLTREYGGLGLGLYVTKRLVEDLGGSIAIDSEIGCGTTITVHVPQGTGMDVRPLPAGRGDALTG